MKKCLLFLVTLLFAVGAWAQTTRTVCATGCDFTTIQAAINAAADGDIIQISEGTYTEALTIGKSLTLIGEGPTSSPTTILKSTANPMINLSVTGKSFSFQNLIIEGNVTNNGIRAAGSININTLTMKDVIARNCQVAIYLAEYWPAADPLTTTVASLSMDNVTLLNNKFIGAYIGKTVLSGIVTNSTVTGNGYSSDLPASWQKTGLQFVNFDEASVPQVTVTNSNFSNNGAGASDIERTGLIIYTAYNGTSTNEIMTVSGCSFENHPLYAVRMRNKYSVGNTATVNGTFTNNYLDIWFNNIVGSTSSTTLVRNTFIGIRTVGEGPTYDYNIIQAAVDAAIANDVILVSEGIYTENVIVNKSSLTIIGDPGDATPGPGLSAPVLDGGSAPGDGFKITNGVTNVTIKGFEVRNYTSSATGIGNGVSAWVAGTSDINIEDNYFHSLGWNGVMVGNDGAIGSHSNWEIKNNILETFYAYGFELTNTSNSTIESNIIHSDATSNPYTCILILGHLNQSGISVKNNLIDGPFTGKGVGFPVIYVSALTGVNLDGITIQQNGIDVTGTAQSITLIKDGTGSVTNVAINYNRLSRLRLVKMYNFIDATNNFWGNENGPINSSVNTYNRGQQAGYITTDSWNPTISPWYKDISGTPGSFTGTSFSPITNDQGKMFARFGTATGNASTDALAGTLASGILFVEAGTYGENVTIPTGKPLTIEGQNGTAYIGYASNAQGLILYSPITFSNFSAYSTSTNIEINNGGKIQNGVDFALPGGTVKAEARTWTEDVTVPASKPLTLRNKSGLTHARIASENKLTLSSPVTLLYFSAFNDGTLTQINEGGVIQNGIDFAAAGGTIDISVGTYNEENLASWKDMEITKSLTLKGAGSGQTIIGLTEGKTNGVEIRGSNLVVHIEGITFTRRTGSTYASNYSLRVAETSSTFTHFSMKDVIVEYAQAPNVHLAAAGIFNEVTIENCQFNYAGSWGFLGAGKIDKMTVTNSDFNYNGQVNTTNGIGFDLAGPGPFTDITFTGGNASNNANKGINMLKTTNAVFSDVTTNNNGSHGIQIWEWASSSSNISFSNITSNGNQDGIQIASEPGKSVSGITFDGGTYSNNVRNNIRFHNGGGTVEDIIIKNATLSHLTDSPGSPNAVVFFDAVNGITFEDNNFTQEQIHWNVWLMNLSSGAVVINGNTFNGTYGVAAWTDVNTSLLNISGNAFLTTEWGLYNHENNAPYTATCNWWGTTDYNEILASVEGDVDVSTWLESDNLEGNCSGEAWRVYNQTTSTWYPTIQGAIDAATAGHEILVEAGIFNEQVIIDKPLSIKGINKETSIIDGSGLTITQDGLVRIVGITEGILKVENFTIINAPKIGDKHFAVRTSGCGADATIVINNNIIDGTGSGEAPDFDYAIYSSGNQADLRFTNNTVSNFRSNSVLLERHTGPSEIGNNTITSDLGTAIFIMSYKSGTDDGDVVEKQHVHNNQINAINGGAGIAVSSAGPGAWNAHTNGKFTNLEISDNEIFNLITFAGIQLQQNGDNGGFEAPVISGNQISAGSGASTNTNGIVLVGGVADADISDNDIDCPGIGIYLLGKPGVWTAEPWSTNTSVLGNTINSVAEGIRVYAGSSNINTNSISASNFGVRNLTPNSINATCNWWGTNDYNTILTKVTANVDFLNYLVTDDIDNPVCTGGVWPVYNVTQTTYYETIQAAINAANAGDEINIAAGYYEENMATWKDLEITKSLTLKGAGSGLTIIGLREFVSPNTALNGVEIRGANLDIHLEGLTFTKRTGATNGPQRALRIGETSSTFNSLTMIDVEVTHATMHNVALDGGAIITTFNMSDCSFTDAGNTGVYSFATIQGGTWTNNIFDLNGTLDDWGGGLHLAGPTSNLSVSVGSMSNNSHVGFAGRRLTNVSFENIVASENNGPAGTPGPKGEQGVGMAINEKSDKSENVTFTNITASNNGFDGFGFTAEPGKSIINISIVGGTVHNNGRIGIYHWPQGGTVSGISIDGTSLSGNRTIDLRNTQAFGYMQNITVKNTTIGGGSGNGVVVLWADGILYENNTVSGRTANGLAVVDGLNVVMTGNTSQNNTVTGAVIANVTGATFTGNIFANNLGSSPNFGNLTIRENSHNVVIEGNEIIGGDYGVWIHSSTSNVAANNNSITGSTTKGLANTSSNSYDATCNWWGTTDYNEILGSVEGDVDVSTWLESDNLEGNCSGEAWRVYNQTTSTWYPTIQGAIDAATAGDVIEVAAGTYNYLSEGSPAPEGLIKVTKGVTIRAAAGTRPVIDGSGFNGIFKIHPSALLPGNTVKIEGFELTGDAATGIAITMQGCFDVIPANVIIRDNWFHGMIGGINMWGAGAYLPEGWTSGLAGIEIANNKFYDMVAAGANRGFGVVIEGPVNAVTAGSDYAVRISGNEFSNLPTAESNPGVGVAVITGSGANQAASVLIEENTFASTVPLGVAFVGGDVSEALVQYNSFDDNPYYSILTQTVTDGPLTASCNWWGSANYNDVLAGISGEVEFVEYLVPGGVGAQTYPWSGTDTYSCTGEEWFVYNVDLALFYPTIQAAIDAAGVNHTITVAAGNFEESFIVDKNGLTIQGPNKDNTGNHISRLPEAIIEGVARVEADNVTIKGFFIDGTDVDQTPSLMKRGILVANTSARANVTIENNIIKNWVTGISLAGGGTFPWVNGASISGNLLINNGIGSTENVNDLTIVNNAFDNAGIGLGGGAVMAIPIAGNNFANVTNGRYIAAASGVTADFDAMLTENTFDKAAYADQTTGSWYAKAIFSTIQAAINVAVPGSTIKVAAGTYNEGNVPINKALDVRGANFGVAANNPADMSVLNPDRGSESLLSGTFLVQSSNVTIDGFAITGNSFAVQAPGTGQSDITIANNYMYSNTGGRSIEYWGSAQSTSNWTITSNRITDIQAIDATAITAFNITNLEISNNTILHSNSTFTGRRGMNVDGGVDVMVSGNYVDMGLTNFENTTPNWTAARYSVQLSSSHRAVSNIEVTGNTFTRGYDGLISLGNGNYDGIEITDNTIVNNVLGLRFQAGTNTPVGYHDGFTITGNTISSNAWAILLQEGSPNPDAYTNIVINYNSLQRSTSGDVLAVSANALTPDGPINATHNFWNGCPSFSGEVEVYPYYTIVNVTPGDFGFNGQVNNITASAVGFTGEITVCFGQTVTLEAGNGSNFLWEGLGLGATKVVRPTETTTYNVTGTDLNGCPLGYASVTVNVEEAPLVSITAEVTGEGTHLTASGAETYLWSPGGSTSPVIVVNPDVTTTYTVVGTTAAGCSGTDSYVVTVVTVSAGPNQFICAGEEVTLTATVTGDDNPTYLWSTGETTKSIDVSPAVTTQYTVTVNGGPSASVKVFVNPKPVANAGPDKILVNGSATLNGSATSGTAPYSYSWSGPSFTSSVQNPSVTLAGIYELIVTDAFGCVSEMDDVEVTAPAANTYTVSGNVAYAFGTVNEQMHDVEVTLEGTGSEGTFIGYTAATGPGNFAIPGVPDGTYKVYLDSPKPWGGVTSADVTAIQNHYRLSRPVLLHGIKRLAADVFDNSNAHSVNVDDRNTVNFRRLGTISSFATGDWVFTRAADIALDEYPIDYANSAGYSDITITVSGADLPGVNFRSLCYGDVNASYTGLKILEIEDLPVYNVTAEDWFELDNYPNPFAGQTTIRYNQPVEGNAIIQVFSMMGDLIATIDSPSGNEGNHEIIFDGHDFAPGLYFYTLTLTTSDDVMVQTGKMIITK